jgi:hypothetical protein
VLFRSPQTWQERLNQRLLVCGLNMTDTSLKKETEKADE